MHEMDTLDPPKKSMVAWFLFHKNLQCHIQAQRYSRVVSNLFKLVAVVRHERVSPWEPSVLTKDNDTKELKYHQTQPNSTEPIKTILWIRLKPIPGFKDWPSVATVAEAEARRRERPSDRTWTYRPISRHRHKWSHHVTGLISESEADRSSLLLDPS